MRYNDDRDQPRAAAFTPGADAFDAWREEVESGSPPPRFRVGGPAFDGVEVGPGQVTLFGGAPGAGKTALVGQFVTDALRLDPGLRLLIANVEMSPGALLDRQLARLSGVDLGSIRGRALDGERRERVEAALPHLEEVVARTAFLQAPFDLENVARSADAFDPDIMVIDYLQRIRTSKASVDARGAVDLAMDQLRRFADAGAAVVAVAAVARSKGEKGSNYESLNLASYRGSSEIEFGADDAFILTGKAGGTARTLKHLKNRDGELRDVQLRFDGAHQSFTAVNAGKTTRASAEESHETPLADLWDAAHEGLEAAEEADERDEG